MTILFAGGELEDIEDAIGLIQFESPGNAVRSDFARCSLAMNSSSSYIHIPLSTNTFWFSCQYSKSTQQDGVTIFRFEDSSEKGLTVRIDENYAVYFTTWDGSAHTDLNTPVAPPAFIGQSTPGIPYKIDVNVNYSSSGFIRFYINGVLASNYIGDVTVSGVTDLTNIHIFPYYYYGNTYQPEFSEIIIADEDTRLMSLKTLVPNAAGDVNQWNNSYDYVDDINVDVLEIIHTDTVDQDFQCAVTGMPPEGEFICKALKINCYAADGGVSGGISLQVGIKTNGVIHLGSVENLDGYYFNYSVLYQVNPETSNRFTPAEIDALQLTIRSKTPV